MDRDKLTNVSAKQAAHAAMRVVDALQDHPEAERAVGLAAAFTYMCEHAGVCHSTVMSIADRASRDADRKRIVEFNGVRAYIRNEMSRDALRSLLS